MDANALLDALRRDICSMPESILYGHDPRIREFKESDDPMRRHIHRNPPYLEVIETAYSGDRVRFQADLERSEALLGEEDVQQENINEIEDGEIRASKALSACAFNKFARHYLMTRHSLRLKTHNRDAALTLVDSAMRSLLLDPTNNVARIQGSAAANLLGWHVEASWLLDPVLTDSMVGMGVPLLNYLGSRACSEALVLGLERHFREGRPGMARDDGPLHVLMRLNSGIVNFGIWADHTASTDEDRRLDKTRALLYRAAYDALKDWAVTSGRIDAETAEMR